MFVMLPAYLAALGGFLVCFILDIAVYLFLRQKAVGPADLKKQFNAWLKGLTQGKHKEVKVEAGAVGLINKSGNVMEVPTSDSPDAPGYVWRCRSCWPIR